ncbi:hypothetical protein C8R43DRAFT_997320 [Mycena crocata]|nr:hypothetical protein C8R43DRAFT_997320 [Mycena crocata]
MSSMAELPQDVLLELAQQLDVVDLMSLLATCRSIRGLQAQKTLWLNVLTRIQKRQNQPIPFHKEADRESLSLEELQTAVQRVHRLMQNFQSPQPRPTSIRTLAIEPAEAIRLIPGENLMVVYGEGRLSCWDISTSCRVAQLEIPNLHFNISKPCVDVQGKALIGSAIVVEGTSRIDQLVAICIDYSDRAHVSFSYTVSPKMTALRFPAVCYISSTIMGLCSQGPPMVVCWSMQSNSVVWTVPLSIGWRQLACLPHGGDIYVMSKKNIRAPTHSVHRISARPSAAPQNPPVTLLSDPSVPSFSQRVGRRTFKTHNHPIFLCSPDYGVFGVSSETLLKDEDCPPVSVVRFWPACFEGEHIHFGPGYSYEYDGQITHMSVGASGTYVLFAAERADDESCLGLLHFRATPAPHATLRELDLDVRDFATFANPYSWIALDDALGTIMVVDQRGSGDAMVVSYC